MITFTTPDTYFQQKWVQKLRGVSGVFMTLTMLCFFFFINTFKTQAQSVCPYNITLVSKTYNATTNQTTFVWSVVNPNPGNGNGNGTVQDLSHWGFFINPCPDPDDALQESDIVRAGYGSSDNAAMHSNLHVSIKPDKSQSCTGNTPILKFDWGTDDMTPTYYSLVLWGNWGTGDLNAYYKSGTRTDCGTCTVAGAGVGCQITCPEIAVNIIPNTSQFLTNRTIGLSTMITGGASPYSYSWTASSGVSLNSTTSATPTATVDAGVSTITFNVTVTDANGCNGTGTITLEQGQLCVGLGAPTVQPATRCGPGEVSLTATGCANGILRWYASADAMTPLFEGNTFNTNVTGTTTFYVSCVVNICESPRAPVLVTVNPIPTVTAEDATVCAGSTVTLMGTPAGGTWSGTGVSGNTFNSAGLAPGEYTVTYSVTANGCTGTATATVTVVALPAVTASNASVCVGGSVALTGSPAGGTWSGTGVSGTTFSAAGLAPGNYPVTYTVTANGCTNSAIATITVVALPSVTANDASVCVGNSITLTGAPAGGSWSGTGVSGNTFSAAGLAPGNYTVTYTVTANGCTAADEATITVVALPTVTANNASVCAGGSVALTGTPAGGTWSGTGVTGSTFNSAGLAPGNYTVTYSVTANGCTASANATITVNAVPGAPSAQNISRCGPGSLTLTATGCAGGMIHWYSAASGGTLLGTGTSYTTDNLTTTTTFYISCMIGDCESARVPVIAIITPAPSTNFTLTGGTYCQGSGGVAVILSGSEIGVNYQLVRIDNGNSVNVGSPIAGTGSAINFGLQPAGSYRVIAVTAGSDVCVNPCTVLIGLAEVTEVPLPTVSASNASVCVGSSITLTGTPAGGSWSGTGVSGNMFSAAGLAPGNYTVTYTVTANGCTNSATATITVVALPTVTANDASVCVGSTVTLTGSPAGGTWSGTGVSGSIFNSAGLAPGNYPVTYTVTANGCTNSATATITVVALPIVTANNASVCVGSSITLTGSPAGGTWSGTGVSGTTFSAAGLAPGNYPVTYTVTANGCTNSANATITVVALPVVTANNASVCVGGTVALTGTPAGGTWSGTGVSGTNFSAVGLAAGNYTVTYTVTANGCTASAEATVTVNPLPASYNLTGGAYCPGTAGVAIVMAGSEVGVNYQLRFDGLNIGAPVPGTGNAITFPAQTATGTYSIIATNATTGCNFSFGAAEITLSPAPTVTANNASVCIGGTVQLTGSPEGGIWSGTGVNASGLFNSAGLAAGNYTVTYTYTNTSGCRGSATATVTVLALPVVTADNASVCVGGSVALVGTPAGGIWSGTGVSGSMFNSAGLAPGNYNVTYTVTSGGCTNSATATVTVIALPVVTATDAIVCLGNSVTLTGSPAGGTWAGTGVTGNTFNSAGLTAGEYAVTYTVTANGCTNSATATVTVVTGPSVSIIPNTSQFLANRTIGLSTVITGGTAPFTYAWSASAGVTLNSTTSPTPTATVAAGVSSVTFNVTVTDANGCTGTATITLEQGELCIGIAAPVTQPVERCGPGEVSLTATGCANGTLRWYSSADATTPLFEGTTFNVNVTGTTTYYVSCMVNICESVRTPIMVMVKPLPVVSATNASVCVGSSITLTGSPAGGTWSGTGVSGTTFSAAGLTPGNYTVTYMVTANGCTNSATATITVVALPTVTANDASVCVGSSITLTGTPAGGTWSGPGVSGNTFSAAGLAPGNYTVTYTVTANGCTASANATITVNALPVVTAPAATVCVGGTVQLTGNPAGGTWSGANVSTSGLFNSTGLAAGNYTVTYSYTNNNGCTAIATQTITVVAYPVCTITGPTSVCVGTTHTYTVPGGATSYQWSVVAGNCVIDGSNSTPTVSVKALGPGEIRIRVTVANGSCVSNCELVINATPLPVTANDVTACPNSTVPLVGTPGGGTWSSANPMIQAAINNTNYTFNSTGIPGGYYPVTYTVTQPDGCTGTDIAYITVIDQSVIGGLAGRVVADGSTGMEVTMNKSTKGIMYQLMRNGVKIGAPVEGNGQPISFGTQEINGDYSVTASTQDGACSTSGGAGRIDPSGSPVVARAGNLNVTAFPNPFNDRIRFSINSEYSGQGVLEVYNVLGEKIKTVYEGYISAGRSQSVDFYVPGTQRVNMIYKLRVGNHETSGKLINIK